VATNDEADLDLAAQLRHLRRARGMTLRDVAGRAGVTESFLSQVERGVASPSVASLQRIARGLGLSIAQLFASPTTAGRVVRRHERRHVTYAGLGAVDEFLTPPTATRLQMILSTIEPGGGTGDEPYTHESDEEVVLVLEGELDLWVADEHYHLQEGDTVTYSSRLPHRNRNGGSEPARVLFAITPPSF
jgi:quercetin dioxygenase-like cupin family protein/DNA-binding phage protein